MLDENGGQGGSCQLHSGTPNLLTGGSFSLLAGGSQLLCVIGQPSENTPEQLGQVLPHMLEWEQKVRGCRECHRCWGSPSFILRNCWSNPLNLNRAEVSQYSFSIPRGKWELMAQAADVWNSCPQVHRGTWKRMMFQRKQQLQLQEYQGMRGHSRWVKE